MKPTPISTQIPGLVFLVLMLAILPELRGQKIQLPDIPAYRTLKCDFHMHTVLSDGSVWPNIRIEEALGEGLDAISITDHLEYQPHKTDIKHPDRNRGYELAQKAAAGSDLLIINGAEITRSMPPGHSNAIFVKDANKLMSKDAMEVFREARAQDAFVFWNHPHWTAQAENGVVPMSDMISKLMEEGLIQGVEVYNEFTYSDEALALALEEDLSIMGNSDIHGLVHSTWKPDQGGHRPITLVFAKEKSEESLKEALFAGRTATWFDNTLVGKAEYLTPLVEASISAKMAGRERVREVMLENCSDVDFILENTSAYNFHNKAAVFVLKAHSQMSLFVKILEDKDEFELGFRVLNAFSAPNDHPEVSFLVK